MNFHFGPGEVLVTLIVVTGITLFFFLRARHIERMSMIEKGILDEGEFGNKPRYFELKIGMLLLGIAMGLFFPYVFEEMGVSLDDDVIYPTGMLFFGGASLILSYFVVRRLDQQDS